MTTAGVTQEDPRIIEGHHYRLLREAAGIPLGRMAERVGVSISHLCHVEKGRRPASPSLEARLDAVLADVVKTNGHELRRDA